MSLDDHLAHFIALLAPPYRDAWRAYVWDRAQQLATEPGLGNLPQMLTEAIRPKASSSSAASGTHAGSSKTGAL